MCDVCLHFLDAEYFAYVGYIVWGYYMYILQNKSWKLIDYQPLSTK